MSWDAPIILTVLFFLLLSLGRAGLGLDFVAATVFALTGLGAVILVLSKE